MGEILGLGITHQPTMAVDPILPTSLRLTMKDPGLPEEFRTPSGWPETMRREWGTDNGASHAAAHRDAIAAELRKARATLDAFRPDFLVVWGDDQYENFHEDIVPAFCVMAYDQVEFAPWKQGPPANYWGEAKDTTFTLRGERRAAKYLAAQLLTQNFDVAYAYKPMHAPLGHAFRNTMLYLDWDRTGFDYPLVPISVNCYGRHLIERKGYLANMAVQSSEDAMDPPSPSPSRCFDLGAACVRALVESPWRVALVASSSWSHAFLTEKNHYLYPDHEADKELYAALLAGDFGAWRSRSLAAVEDSGQHELLNWFCLVGAMAELGRRPDRAEYFESSIMNSNKVIATFLPEATP
jgi:hypothetical protein